MFRFAIFFAICFAAAAADPPSSWIDPETGHRILRLTAEPDSARAAVAFSWRPHFYRAGWLYVLCLPALIATAWIAHELRMRQAQSRFQAVLQERGRVAREMHDTLIQGCGSVPALLEASFALGDGAPETNASCWNSPATRSAPPSMKPGARSGISATSGQFRYRRHALADGPAASSPGSPSSAKQRANPPRWTRRRNTIT